MGGENAEPDGLVDPDAGSSPRGRGKRLWFGNTSRRSGLIPTRAGKTCSRLLSACTRAAHPHAGGENMFTPSFSMYTSGSSPRGRGKPELADDSWGDARLIPARAGKTQPYRAPSAAPSAHPRAGGENQDRRVQSVQSRGSSPRGRGKHLGELALRVGQGLIPARAGNRTRMSATTRLSGLIPARAGKTSPRARCSVRRWVHPRVDGENG